MGKKKKRQVIENGEMDMNIIKSQEFNREKIKKERSEMNETIKHNRLLLKREKQNKIKNNVSDVNEAIKIKKKKRKSSETHVEEKQSPKLKIIKTNPKNVDTMSEDVSHKNASKKQKTKNMSRKEDVPEINLENGETQYDKLCLDNKVNLNEKSTHDVKDVNKKSKTKINKVSKVRDAEFKKNSVTSDDMLNKILEKTTPNKLKFLNEDEAEVKDDDIDKFCDDITEEDNKTYENWVKLFEENFKKSKKTTS